MTRGPRDIMDLVVIGSGGAAMAAAITARRRGAAVVLVEQGTLGGTCVNVGCVPSKTLLAAAGIRHTAQANPFPGVPTSAGPVDLAALVAQKDELVGRLRQNKYAAVADAHGFEVRKGAACFADGATLLVDGEPLSARAYLVATGGQPTVPDLPGLAEVDFLTSTTPMKLTELPESLVVIGGGYVGMAQAQLFAQLGAAVTVVGRMAPRAEPELAGRLQSVFEDDGITTVPERGTAVERESGGEVTATTDTGRRVGGERLLLATGRTPRTADLGLAAAEVAVDHGGHVLVDAAQRTSNPAVFAAGDATAAPQHVYVAAAAGRVAAVNAWAVRLGWTTPGCRRWCVHQAPAGLGRPDRGRSAGAWVPVPVSAARPGRCPPGVGLDTRGAIKLVADADSGRVLGVHALADGAGEMMLLAATDAIKAGFTVDALADTCAPYLTMAESLRLVAGLFRDEMPTSCCA